MFRSRGRNTSWYTAKSRQGSWLGRSGAKHVNEWWIIYLTMKLFKSVAPCSMYKIIENFRREKRCFLRKKVDYWKTGFINRHSNTCCLTYRFKMLEVILINRILHGGGCKDYKIETNMEYPILYNTCDVLFGRNLV